ncbi:hypothetical protein [Saccharopolyspora sp. CA-218241]|uniref:hypothetical protein n=1 Tax=Saccharopolyspora sp. CA-218241 TaxID=3240027 RepID=UPI003D9595E1
MDSSSVVLVGASVGAGAVVLVRSLRRTGWRDAWTFGSSPERRWPPCWPTGPRSHCSCSGTPPR